MEYEEAVRLDLPCLIYFKNDDVKVLPKFIERNPDSIKKLDVFKKELSKKHTVGFFNGPHDLSIKILVDLSSQVKTLDYEVLTNIMNYISNRFYLIQKDNDSKFHYLQKRLESAGIIETDIFACPVCGRLLEKGEPTFSMKHPVCADCIVYRTDDVQKQLETDHPEFVDWIPGLKKSCEEYLKKRDKA
jgi:hypothetical protein